MTVRSSERSIIESKRRRETPLPAPEERASVLASMFMSESPAAKVVTVNIDGSSSSLDFS
uniref:Uncharacterized protein n=1 Tax=Brassica oleracea var. oleracea TaxID=109376 RepID=A0A0D3B3H8_BRAOL